MAKLQDAVQEVGVLGLLHRALVVEVAGLSLIHIFSGEVEEDASSIEAAYGDICAAYAVLAASDSDEGIADELSENVDDLFNAYNALYLLVTEPSGGIDDFADDFNEYSGAITECNLSLIHI